ncbi:hypothetical protein BC939DRAFT_390978 [Gamsiella multidivaricata]|uniref:uncharacterized protein n=1 Tax=Gamsiella multidivaricata TaxID=101098 RepID=UPI00221FFF6C|nr:uncharacterized protein BC939DRAFT_390978 [Gamsiella multidivaricata]KAI7832568.1 hypothetical protein BC939DRAFT_390978 [Gamsiella multidivaricata]
MADPINKNHNCASTNDDTEVVDEGNRSILLDIISQLSKGGDLHRITLPTFVLEPRSMLERITDFMSHPEIIIKANKMDDPVERFVAVTRYFLSGWHIKPKGVKKPYNPILGEQFRSKWIFADGTEAFYVAEQVSHHPPISTYYYASPENHLSIVGDVMPKSKFLGNSAATLMQGEINVSFTNRPGENYLITMPNVYARGILFGTMLMELGDAAGYFSGSYNSIAGKIKRISTGEVLYDISGKWSDEIYITKDGNKEVFFDARTASIHPKIVAPEEAQEPHESRRLWSKLTAALKANNQPLATEEKSKVEDAQRARSKQREEREETYVPRYFEPVNDNFHIKLKK